MKTLLLIVVVACCLLAGMAISVYFVRRKYFFADLCDFCEFYKVKISFSRQKLTEIIKEVKPKYHKDFAKFLDLFQLYLSGDEKINKNKILIFLNEEEKSSFYDFFLSLGSLSYIEEVERVKVFQRRFNMSLDDSTYKKDKFSILFFKLFICFAVFLIIIFV